MRAKLLAGTVEEKRDSLMRLRGLRSEEASRIASASLEDKEPIVRATAASSVLFLPRAEAASLLLPLAGDRDEFVRREAVFAIGETGESTAAPTVIERLRSDKSAEVRTASAVALGKLGAREAVSPLVSVLRQPPTEDNEMLRRAAARSIGQISESILTGKVTYETPQNFLPPHFKDIRTLGAMDVARAQLSGEAAELLMKVLADDREAGDTRREAAFALGAMRYGAAAELLGRCSKGPDPFMAEICNEALIKIRAVE